jgi:NAD(P)H-hydrate epimerase
MHSLIDSRILDVNAEVLGVNMETLMENAGRAVADLVLSLNPKRVLVACGSGNNGGDGYTAGTILLKRGIDVYVDPVSPPSSELCKKKYESFLKAGGKLEESTDLSKFDVVVDALLGVGISGTPREPYSSYIRRLNESGARIISVDVPSGLSTEIAVKPQYTVTMQFQKDQMNTSNSGSITVADVGFPKDALEMIGPGDLLAFPQSERSSHKGDNGICIIVGGSNEYFGAPIYMAKSALRMGPDLVILFAPEVIHELIASNVQDIILHKSGVEKIEFNYDLMKTIKERADSIAIGPGISKRRGAIEEAAKIIDYSLSLNKKMVIDADALQAVSSVDDFRGETVLTPHRGEFISLFGLEPTEDNARKAAGKVNAVILLKGETDMVTDGKILKKNRSYHHQSMTRGGTGDLITGAVAGLLSRKVDPLHSAFLASYLIGHAGLSAFNSKGYGYLTSEIADIVPEILISGKKQNS